MLPEKIIYLMFIFLLIPLYKAYGQSAIVKILINRNDTIWLKRIHLSGIEDSMMILTPEQVNKNLQDSIGYGTKATAKLTVSNVQCNSCPPPQTGTLFHLISESATVNGRISHDSYNNANNNGSILTGRRGRGTANSPTAAQTDDVLVALGSDGYGTSSYAGNSLGGLSVRAAATMTDISRPVYFNISTTPVGATNPIERVRIQSNGDFRLNNLASIGFVQTSSDGTFSTAALTNGQIVAALGFTPANAASSGTVTSVGITAGAGVSVSGSPVTSSGNITVANTAPDLLTFKTYGVSGLLSNAGKVFSDTISISSASPTVSLSGYLSTMGATGFKLNAVTGFRSGATATNSPQVAVTTLTSNSFSCVVTQQNTSTITILGINVLSGLPMVLVPDPTNVKLVVSFTAY